MSNKEFKVGDKVSIKGNKPPGVHPYSCEVTKVLGGSVKLWIECKTVSRCGTEMYIVVRPSQLIKAKALLPKPEKCDIREK